MATVFDTYQEEFTNLSADISKKISDVRSYELDQAKKRELLRNVDVMLVSASDLVKQMEMEVRSASSPNAKRDLQTRVGDYKKSLNVLQGDYRRAKEAEDRRGLMNGGSTEVQVYGFFLGHVSRTKAKTSQSIGLAR